MRQYRVVIAIVIFLFALLTLAERNRPHPINWKLSFAKDDKIPYGGYILYQMLPSLFGDKPIEVVKQPMYNQFLIMEDSYWKQENEKGEEQEKWGQEHTQEDTDSRGTGQQDKNELEPLSSNYVFISQNFEPDEVDIEYLLPFVHNGNDVFIAAETFDEHLTDTLGIAIERLWSWGITGKDSFELFLAHEKLKDPITYSFPSKVCGNYFSRFDTAQSTILGLVDDDKHVNFIKTKYGQGNFYLHVSPLLFTNYCLASKTKADYAEKVFTHLPNNQVFWDEYYKPGRKESATPLRYVLSVVQTRWAIYVGLLGIALFMLFEAKRRQRIIPIVTPLRNTTLEFAKTVGMLYFQRGDHRDLAEKKITHFFGYLRQRHLIKQVHFERDFYELLSQKTGIPISNVEALFRNIIAIRTSTDIDPKTLIQLNQQIDDFVRIAS